MSKVSVPSLSPHLRPGERILINEQMAATTVIDGVEEREAEGFLIFRKWELTSHASFGGLNLDLEWVSGEALPLPVAPPYEWRLVSDFFLGSIGREGLTGLLNRAASEGSWRGVIVAEAATCFADGSKEVKQPGTGSLEVAKAWVISKLSELLEAEEQVSQALVMGHGERGFELSLASWPHLPLVWNET